MATENTAEAGYRGYIRLVHGTFERGQTLEGGNTVNADASGTLFELTQSKLSFLDTQFLYTGAKGVKDSSLLEF